MPTDPAPALQNAPQPGYWPREALNLFLLRTAAHHQTVRSDMMLGDRQYAIEQLAHAYAVGDAPLRQLVLRLLPWFAAAPAGSRWLH